MSHCPRCGLPPTTGYNDTGLDELSDSFYIPSEANKAAITRILDKSRAEIEHLEAAMIRLQQRRDTLIETVVRPCTSAISNLRKFPVEIMQGIFELYLPPRDSSNPFDGWIPKRGMNPVWRDTFNIRLMLVCRRWNSIIVTSEHFWSCIWIRSQDFPEYTARRLRLLSKTKMKMCSSGSLHVRLSLGGSGLDFNAESPINDVAKDLIFRTRERWEDAHVSILGGIDLTSSQLFSSLVLFQRLRRLVLTFPRDYDDQIVHKRTTTKICLTAADAPSLVDVTFAYLDKVVIELPWSQLARLSIYDLPERKLPGLMEKLTNVETIWLHRYRLSLDPPRNPCKGPSTLRTFLIGFSLIYEHKQHILKYLQIPSLRSFTVASLQGALPLLAPFFAQLCYRRLTSLRIDLHHSTSYDGPPLLRALSCLSFLQTLVLCGSSTTITMAVMDVLMRELQLQESGSFTLLPALSSFALLRGWPISTPLLLKTMRIRLGRPFDGQSTNLHFLSRFALDEYIVWEKENGTIQEYSGKQDAYSKEIVSRLCGLCTHGQSIEFGDSHIMRICQGWMEGH